MFRTLSITAALTALTGFAVGWFAFSKPNSARQTTVPQSTTAAEATPPLRSPGRPVPDATPVAVVQRFALRPGDVSADRETPAIAIAPDRTIVLAWASQANAGDTVRTLYLARSTDGGTTFDNPVAWRSVPIYRYSSGNPARSPERKMTVLDACAAPPDGGARQHGSRLGRGDRRRSHRPLPDRPLARRRKDLLRTDCRAWRRRLAPWIHHTGGRRRWRPRLRLD